MIKRSKINLRKIKSLYYKKGYSAREIAELFNCTIDNVYGFMKSLGLARRDLVESNRIQFKRKEPSFQIKKRLTEKERRLKIAGIMLYWAEGSTRNGKKQNCTVDLANSNPEMIKLFLVFLRRICGINENKLRVYLYTYADQDVKAQLKYWQKTTNIPLSQFTKPYIREDFLAEKSGKMKYGLVHIRYNDKKLLLQITKWIKGYLKKNI